MTITDIHIGYSRYDFKDSTEDYYYCLSNQQCNQNQHIHNS